MSLFTIIVVGTAIIIFLIGRSANTNSENDDIDDFILWEMLQDKNTKGKK